jgi:hypothetical protein
MEPVISVPIIKYENESSFCISSLTCSKIRRKTIIAAMMPIKEGTQ